jgi:hypothetical protein
MNDGAVQIRTVDLHLVDLARDENHRCPCCGRGGILDPNEGVYLHAYTFYINQFGQYTRIVLDGCFHDESKFGSHTREHFVPAFDLLYFLPNRVRHSTESENK